MEAQIINLLESCYSGNNETIQYAENCFIELRQNYDFFEILLNLATNNLNINIKKESIIVFQKSLFYSWKNFDQEIKSLILLRFLNFLDNIEEKLIKIGCLISDKLIDFLYFKGEWTDLLNQILIRIQIDSKYILSGIILTKSICKLLKNPKIDLNNFYNNFINDFLPLLTNIILNSKSFLILDMTIHCISRLILTDKKKLSELLIESSFLIFEYSLEINQIEKNEEFFNYIIKIFKFFNKLINISSNNFTENQILNLFKIDQIILESHLSSKIDCKALELLYNILFIGKWISLFELNLDYFINNIFPYFYYLKQDEILLMDNDPSLFISSIHKSCQNWSDPRSSCLRIISKISKNSEIVLQACFQRIDNILTLYPNEIQNFEIFSNFLFLSATIIRNSNNIYFNDLLNKLNSFFTNSDFIIRSSAFMLLSEAIDSENSISTIEYCLNHLTDNYLLVQYYSSIALSTILDNIKENEISKEIQQLLSPHVEQIFSLFVNLANEFHNENFTSSLSSLVKFFKNEILPFSGQFCLKMLDIFIDSSKAEGENEFNNATVVIEMCLFTLIELISQSKEISNEYLLLIYEKVIFAIKELNGLELMDKTFDLAAKIIISSHQFYSEFWIILPILFEILDQNNIITLEDLSMLLLSLIDKDLELNTRLDIVTILFEKIMFIFKLNDDNWSSCAEILSGLCIRNNGVFNYLDEIIQQMIIKLNDSEGGLFINNSIGSLFSTLIYIYKEKIFSLFNDNLSLIIGIWIDSASFPFFPASIINNFEIFSIFDIQPTVLAAAIHSIKIHNSADDEIILNNQNEEEEDNNNMKFNLDDFETDICDIQGHSLELPHWFDHSKLIEEIYYLIQNIKKNNFNIYQECLSILNEDDIIIIDQLLEISKKFKI